MSDETPPLRPHGDPLLPQSGERENATRHGADTDPADLPAPEPIDDPDRSGDEDPGAGAD
jgi:hypothetical protein